MRRLWWVWLFIAPVAVVTVVLVVNSVVTNAIGRVTVDTAPDGSSRTLYWRDYPGVAGVDPAELLSGPTLEAAQSDGDAMVVEIRDAISAEFGLAWVGDPNADDEGHFSLFPDVENGFGGKSMLTLINSPTWQSTTVLTAWADKQRIIQIIGEVAARHGFAAPVLDHERPDVTEEDRERDFGGATPAAQVFIYGSVTGPSGQWLFFGIQDPSKDLDGRFKDRYTVPGWEPASVTLSYGANALLPEADRAEFERRLIPFVGATPPDPLED